MKVPAANLHSAQMQEVDLSGAHLEGANLSGAQMRMALLSRTTLSRAQMRETILHYSHLTGEPDQVSVLHQTNLSGALNDGGMSRYVDLTPANFDSNTDFRNTFLDGSVKMTEAFRAQMGNPCQWAKKTLVDTELYARWRGWIELDGSTSWNEVYVPDTYRDITPIPPPPGCVWKTGPMPASAPE